MPSLLTGIGFDGESETVTVMVDGVSDTFEIKMLPAPFDEKKNLKQKLINKMRKKPEGFLDHRVFYSVFQVMKIERSFA